MSTASPLAAARPSAQTSQALVRLLPLLGLFLLVAALTNPAHFGGDEVPILAATHRLLHGGYALQGTMDSSKYLWHGPGLPALLAPLVALGMPLSGLRLTSPLLMFAAVLMFHRLLRLRFGPRAALIGAYALALYAPAYYVLGTIDKDPLALLLAVTALDATGRYLKDGRPHRAVLGGLALGWLAMTRLEYGLVITLALGLGLGWWLLVRVRRSTPPHRVRAARRWTMVCAIGMAACLPWLTYTYLLTHHLFYWGNSGGISLYWMSSPNPSQLGAWHASHSVFADPALASYRPFFHYLATLGPVRADLQLRHVALMQALGHPAKYALNLLANLGRMFIGYPFSFRLSIGLLAGLAVINGALLAGLAAAVRPLLRGHRSLPPETVPCLMFGALAFAVHLFPSAEPRMLVPFLPVLIWLIAHGLRLRYQPRTGAQEPRFRPVLSTRTTIARAPGHAATLSTRAPRVETTVPPRT